MKPYEWAILIATLLLVYAGFFLNGRDMLALAIVCYVAAGALSVGYIYSAKIRPIGRAKQTFLNAAIRNQFVPLKQKPWKKAVVKLIREFPGFDDFFLSVDDLHAMENDAGIHFVGMYSLSGQGLNFGYFMVGILRPQGALEFFTLDKILDRGNDFDFADELALGQLPTNVQAVLRDFPYDFHFQNNLFMADFDARYLREDNFGESFDRMINALSSLSAA